MPVTPKDKKIIGRAEQVSFPELGIAEAYARIDTGARTAAIWASKAEIVDGKLAVVFFDAENPHYTGEVHYFDAFERTVVASSNGLQEERYKVLLLVKLGGKRIRGSFTLADRSTQVYPVLIGRNILRGKFIVDVKQGTTLVVEEKLRSEALKTHLRDQDSKK